ncbi:MAG: hypothetical protein QOI54_1661 [Actinomycetota bacterium]|jgi:hypothetical protein|nr:hypothetical protein [Actinomycetota bacterium]
MTGYLDRRGGSFGGWLVLLALGYGFFHHVGILLRGLGEVGDTHTRWADWIDLATPYVVTGAAAGALLAAHATRRAWVVFWFAAVLYTQGHGIHLAANSVGNVVPGEPAHLWDERVGHYLFYAGFWLLVAVLAATLSERRPRGGPGAHLLALVVGFTHFTNSVEGQTAYAGIGVAVLFVLWGLVTRQGLGRVLVTAYGFSLLLFAAYAVWQGGLPEFTEVGLV